MPAPAAALMAKQTASLYGMQLSPDALKYLEQVFKTIEKAWKKWQDSIQIGANLVSGAGVGAFAGAGTSGKLVPGSPMKIDSISFAKQTPEQKKFTGEIFKAIEQKFDLWLPTFVFSSVPYLGTSGATPIAPGPIAAENTPGPLAGYGKGSPLKGIAAIAKAQLLPPMFLLKAPEAKSGELVDAICKTVEMSFETIWLTTTQVTGSKFVGPGTPGGGVVSLPSTPGGKLV